MSAHDAKRSLRTFCDALEKLEERFRFLVRLSESRLWIHVDLIIRIHFLFLRRDAVGEFF